MNATDYAHLQQLRARTFDGNVGFLLDLLDRYAEPQDLGIDPPPYEGPPPEPRKDVPPSEAFLTLPERHPRFRWARADERETPRWLAFGAAWPISVTWRGFMGTAGMMIVKVAGDGMESLCEHGIELAERYIAETLALDPDRMP